MKKLSSSSYSLIAIMAVMLVVIGLSVGLKYAADKLLPMLIGSLVFILAAVELGREISARGRAGTMATEGKTSAGEETIVGGRRFLSIGAWILGFSLAIYLVGFIMAMFLFVASYMKQHGAGWLTTIISAVLCTAVMYSVFELALRVGLYSGLLRTWLGF